MKDNWTLYKFLQNYYKSSPNKSEKQFLLNMVCNMGISNYTIGLLIKLMQKSDEINIDSITDETLISFFKEPDNITKIQVNFSDYKTIANRGSTYQRATYGLDTR